MHQLTTILASGDLTWAEEMSTGMALLICLPFALLLLSIAVLPLVAHHWWESNKNRGIVAFLCGAPVAVGFIIFDWFQVAHAGIEYLAFIALLGSLFVISGGIYVKGAFAGTPLVNTMFLSIGAIFASFMGTTGAAMVLIRPLLRANKKRAHKTHIIIFFIFIVANIGGCLTPLGDPPLFLGFLKGVPFTWTFRLVMPWLMVNFVLLIMFNLLDQYMFNKEDVETKGSLVEDVQPGEGKGIALEGKANLLLLLGVVATIYCSGSFLYPGAKKALKPQITKDQLCAVAGKVASFHADQGRMPVGLDELLEKPADIAEEDWPKKPYLKKQDLTDAWGNEFHYRSKETHFEIVSFAEGNEKGGSDFAEDIVVEGSVDGHLPHGGHWKDAPGFASMGVQIIIMSLLALLSLKVTPGDIRKKNEFTWHPIIEVAVLFAGIFMAMIPAVLILKARGQEFGITEPWQFFWLTGGLSAFLDNAPTYVTFLALGQGTMVEVQGSMQQAIPDALATVQDNLFLFAISIGAVFMGALTYIGNGPNFMVKAIAEEAKIKMPTFFGYMLWSVAILVPIFIVVTFIFLLGGGAAEAGAPPVP